VAFTGVAFGCFWLFMRFFSSRDGKNITIEYLSVVIILWLKRGRDKK